MGQQDISIDLNANLNVYQNTAQDCIVTTRDKLELVLIKTEKAIATKKAWMTPLGLFVTCIVALSSADFNDFILTASVWKALFVLSSIVCGIWLIQTIIQAWKNRKGGNIEGIINQIISESKPKQSLNE